MCWCRVNSSSFGGEDVAAEDNAADAAGAADVEGDDDFTNRRIPRNTWRGGVVAAVML